MRRAVIDWCDRHPVATYALIVFTIGTIAFGVLFTLMMQEAGDPWPSPTSTPTPTPTPTVSCAAGNSSDYQYGVDECKVTLKDGRTVTCVNISKGTSCDWAHAAPKKGK